MGTRLLYDYDFAGSSQAKRRYSKIGSSAPGHGHSFSSSDDEKCGIFDAPEAAENGSSDGSHERTDQCIKSTSKRTRLADICVGQSNHQQKILEALTPVPCQNLRSLNVSSCSSTSSFRPYQASSWHTSMAGGIRHQQSREMFSSFCSNSIAPASLVTKPSHQTPFSIPVAAQSSEQEAHSMWSEENYADSGRYSRIAALFSSLGSCEGLNDSWGGTDMGIYRKSDSHLDGLVGDDDAISLLFKYTHVSGGRR
jgi:hypothetical protein